jgi:hypothetical protein
MTSRCDISIGMNLGHSVAARRCSLKLALGIDMRTKREFRLVYQHNYRIAGGPRKTPSILSLSPAPYGSQFEATKHQRGETIDEHC